MAKVEDFDEALVSADLVVDQDGTVREFASASASGWRRRYAANITSSIIAFSFSDGSDLEVDQSNGSFGFFYVSTDSSGTITQWSGEAGICNDPSCTTADFVLTENGLVEGNPGPYPGFAIDFASVNYPKGNPCITVTSFDATSCSLLNTAYVFNTPGTWTVSTPEPSGMLLLISGFIGLILLGFRLNTRTL